MSGATAYADAYRGIDFRKEPHKYVVGKGEQGVLIAEPYKSEILPHWRFATPEKAQKSAEAIYSLFIHYGKDNDFVGMDMARKFLQMGFTRSRRYANHASGKKYTANGAVAPQDKTSEATDKAVSAAIFLKYYRRALNNSQYRKLQKENAHN
jgi:hypothetical protein